MTDGQQSSDIEKLRQAALIDLAKKKKSPKPDIIPQLARALDDLRRLGLSFEDIQAQSHVDYDFLIEAYSRCKISLPAHIKAQQLKARQEKLLQKIPKNTPSIPSRFSSVPLLEDDKRGQKRKFGHDRWSNRLDLDLSEDDSGEDNDMKIGNKKVHVMDAKKELLEKKKEIERMKQMLMEAESAKIKLEKVEKEAEEEEERAEKREKVERVKDAKEIEQVRSKEEIEQVRNTQETKQVQQKRMESSEQAERAGHLNQTEQKAHETSSTIIAAVDSSVKSVPSHVHSGRDNSKSSNSKSTATETSSISTPYDATLSALQDNISYTHREMRTLEKIMNNLRSNLMKNEALKLDQEIKSLEKQLEKKRKQAVLATMEASQNLSRLDETQKALSRCSSTLQQLQQDHDVLEKKKKTFIAGEKQMSDKVSKSERSLSPSVIPEKSKTGPSEDIDMTRFSASQLTNEAHSYNENELEIVDGTTSGKIENKSSSESADMTSQKLSNEVPEDFHKNMAFSGIGSARQRKPLKKTSQSRSIIDSDVDIQQKTESPAVSTDIKNDLNASSSLASDITHSSPSSHDNNITSNDKSITHLSSIFHGFWEVQYDPPETFRPFDSPLKIFDSYRLSPMIDERQRTNILRSITYNGSLINDQIFKRYCATESSGGECTDTKCAFLHSRDFKIDDTQLIVAFAETRQFSSKASERSFKRKLRSQIQEKQSFESISQNIIEQGERQFLDWPAFTEIAANEEGSK